MSRCGRKKNRREGGETSARLILKEKNTGSEGLECASVQKSYYILYLWSPDVNVGSEGESSCCKRVVFTSSFHLFLSCFLLFLSVNFLHKTREFDVVSPGPRLKIKIKQWSIYVVVVVNF